MRLTSSRIAVVAALPLAIARLASGAESPQGACDVAGVAAGGFHTLALRTDATVWTWGANGMGQLGDGTTADSHVPVPVAGLGGIQAIAAGADHSLALQGDGT